MKLTNEPLFSLVLLTVASYCVGKLFSNHTVVYVLPNLNLNPSLSLPSCQTQSCYTLKQLTSMYKVETNTTIVLLPGTHIINSSDSESRLLIDSVQNVKITGQSSMQQNTSKSLTPNIVCLHDCVFSIEVHNVNNLLLRNFEIVKCNGGHTVRESTCIDPESASIKIVNSSNIGIHRIGVHDGNTIGLYLLQSHGIIDIIQANFSNNQINFIFTFNEYYLKHRARRLINLNVKDSTFQFGRIATTNKFSATGIVVEFSLVKFSFGINFENLTLDENQNGDIQLRLSVTKRLPVNFSYLIIQSLTLTNGVHNCVHKIQCHGLFIQTNGIIGILVSDSLFTGACMAVLTIKSTLAMTNVTFKDTQCNGIALILGNVKNCIVDNLLMVNSKEQLLGVLNSTIRLQGTFINNTGGLFVFQSTLMLAPNAEIRFENNDCTLNGNTHCSTFEIDGSTVVLGKGSQIIFKNNTGSSSGGFRLSFGTIYILENVTVLFDSNSGKIGGAVSLYAGSRILICDISFSSIWDSEGIDECEGGKSTISFIGNHASERGGAVYIEDSGFMHILGGLAERFLQKSLNVVSDRRVGFYFANNTAELAGSAFYGGWLMYYNPSIFHFSSQDRQDLSLISSDPVRVCICFSSIPDCSITEYNISNYYPGQSFNISVVAVGQRLGTAPSVVNAKFNGTLKNSSGTLLDGQYVQNTNVSCTTLRYTVFSLHRLEILVLSTENHNVPNLQGLYQWLRYYENMTHYRDGIAMLKEELSVTIQLGPCPVGFTLNSISKMCDCDPVLVKHDINDCDIETLNIHLTGNKWINATYTHPQNGEYSYGVIVHDNCPFDYCTRNISYIQLENPDDQCAPYRTGILCGACQKNFSKVLGNSKCKKCTNMWVFVVVPGFILMGILLIVLMTALDLTVSSGLLNGLIFYANTVRGNEFMTTFSPSNGFSRTFIAWLNLDLGIETCFYDGLDAYTEIWLQFLFPLYLWAVTVIIIVTSRHYTFAARLCGSNIVQVLATLFFLSYTKLIQTVISIFQFTLLVYPDGYKREVWRYDGNVDYLKGKHIPLFIAGLLVLFCLSIPYTLTLLFIQWLRKFNHHRLLRWVGKLKPLFDAYTGPFKEKHCYWFGVLLLVRAALYLVFSLNVSGDTSLNLMAIITAAACIMSYLVIVGGVYESMLANITDVSFMLNLIILTSGIHFYGHSERISTVSVSIAFSEFVFIILYHFYLRITETRRGKQLDESLRSKFKHMRQKVLRKYLAPPAQTSTERSHSSIELKEPLLVDIMDTQALK